MAGSIPANITTMPKAQAKALAGILNDAPLT